MQSDDGEREQRLQLLRNAGRQNLVDHPEQLAQLHRLQAQQTYRKYRTYMIDPDQNRMLDELQESFKNEPDKQTVVENAIRILMKVHSGRKQEFQRYVKTQRMRHKRQQLARKKNKIRTVLMEITPDHAKLQQFLSPMNASSGNIPPSMLWGNFFKHTPTHCTSLRVPLAMHRTTSSRTPLSTHRHTNGHRLWIWSYEGIQSISIGS